MTSRSNRTFMELKFMNNLDGVMTYYRSNRTFMELKFVNIAFNCCVR